MVFPREIYGEIISYIKDQRALYAILLASPMLSQEVEMVLYREPTFQTHHQDNFLRHLSTCNRVARHVRSLQVEVEDGSHTVINRALHALYNLKGLELWDACSTPQQDLSSLMLGVSFQLHKFSTNFPINQYLRKFLRSQPQIVYLKLELDEYSQRHESDLALLQTDLPALTALDYFAFSRPMEVYFSTFFITNAALYQCPPIPLPSVRALKTNSLSLIGSLAAICPNLRYLEMHYDTAQTVDLRRISSLEKLKLWSSRLLPQAAEILLGIYTRQNLKTLKCLEMCYNKDAPDTAIVCRVQERFNPDSTVPEPMSEVCVEDLNYHEWEWTTWRG